MANITGELTDDAELILEVSSDPSLSTGVAAPVSSIAMLDNGSNGYGAWLKTGVSNTAWNPIAVTSGTFTQGSVIFAGASGILTQNNSELFWDNTNFRLGIGTSSPAVSLAVEGNVTIGAGDGGTPSAFNLRGPAAVGMNITGADWTIDASNGTGSGGSGNIIFRTAAPIPLAPAYVSSTQVITGNVNTFSFTHVVPAMDNGILLVEMPIGEYYSVTSVTYNSVALTLAQALNSDGTVRVELWYLLNPPQGSYTLTVNTSGFGNTICQAINFENVNQTTPFGTFATQAVLGSTPSLTLTTTNSETVIDILCAQVTETITGSQTAIYNAFNTVNIYGSGSYVTAGSSSTTVSYSLSSSVYYAYMAVPLMTASTGTQSDMLTEVVRISPTSGLIGTSSGLSVQTQVVTTSVSLTAGQINTVANSSSPITITLPQASTLLTTIDGISYAQYYTFSNWGTGTVTLAAHTGDLIVGSSTLVLRFQYSSVTLLPSSLGWSVT